MSPEVDGRALTKGLQRPQVPSLPHLHGCVDLAWRSQYSGQQPFRLLTKGEGVMNPIAAGVAGALISGVAMYAVGTKAAQMDTLTQEPALVHPVDTQVVPASYANSLRPIAAPSIAATPVRNTARRTTAQRPVSSTASAQDRGGIRDEREIVREDDRSWGKTAMIVGGSAAGGAGVGGIVGGKKGALIGAAIGGGAASIYEATQRR
jgi:hypothetical protein